MTQRPAFSRTMRRRSVLAGLGAAVLAAPAMAQSMLDAAEFGVTTGGTEDQSAAMQKALDAAHDQGRTLVLPGGQIFVKNLQFPSKIRLVGQPGATMLIAAGSEPIGAAYIATDLAIEGIGFSAGVRGLTGDNRGLLEIESSVSVRLVDCSFVVGGANAIVIEDAEVSIEDCDFSEFAESAIFAHNSRGVRLEGNRIRTCGNAGIRIWRDAPGRDGSRILGNVISGIGAEAGGNGENGNGINVYRADDVIVSDNQISDCAFTAIRLNSTNNTQVRGNTCTNSGEVAIFSEFGFSGSVIMGNIIDKAAAGISMTNFDQGGHLATCSGNIVRNIQSRSAVNPDTTPFGIFAEADATISGNVVEAVPGTGIGAGWGPYLRNVIVADNIVRDVDIGIAVSVAEGAGKAVVSGNMIANARRAGVAGMAWAEVRSDDLVRDAANYPNVTLSANSLSER